MVQINREKSDPLQLFPCCCDALPTIAFAPGSTSELFTGYGTSPSLYSEFAVSDTVADSGWPAHAHHCGPCHSEGAPAEQKRKNTLKIQPPTSTANGMENRKPSLNCLMLDVSPQTP